MSVNTSDPLIGRLIDGRYQVRSRIARGGMATVYLATDLRLERRVAVKIMHGHLADDHQFKQRFIQEARSAARLAHPNVVNVFDQGQDDDSAYLVMEYLPGITLRDLLHDYGALTPEQTIDIASAVLSGLAAAHRAGIVHRDLKPENVLLADDGRIKIGDFGLARAASANTATGAALLGTIAYLSPELVTRGIADTRSDIYAVGIMMFEMLTGEQPYKGEQPMQIAYQHANDSVPAPSSVRPGVPAELDELVLWATARDPEDRPADARVLLDQVKDTESELRTALPGGPVGRTIAQPTLVLPAARATAADAETQVLGAPRPAPLSQAATAPTPPLSDATAALATASRKRRGRGWIIALVVVLLVALAGGAGWYFGWGPGANVAVPAVAGSTTDQATARLTAAGLRVSPTPRSVPSVDIPAGQVSGTDPKRGSSVAKDSVVTLLVSTGPRLLPLDKLAGQTESIAKTLVRTHWTLGEVSRRFDKTVPEGTVIGALGTVDGKTDQSLDAVTQYGEKQPISLIVSAGQLPDVAGKSVDQATKELEARKLGVAAEQQHANSDTIDEGAVIGIVGGDYSQPIAPGASVTLIVSDGPPPVQIPAVTGLTWDKAKAALTGAGFAVKITNGGPVPGLAAFSPTSFTVEKVDPAEGGSAPKGSTIKVTLQNNF